MAHPHSDRRKRFRRKPRVQLFQQLESRLVLDSAWQNPLNPSDVNNDSTIAPLDALVILNDLNRNGSRQLPARTDPLAPFLDVNGDRSVTPLDALVIINELNRGDSIDTRGFVTVPLKTLPGTASQVIRAAAQLTIGTDHFKELGVFAVDDLEGSINGVSPSSAKYARTALLSSSRRILFTGNNASQSSTQVDLPAGRMLYVYVLQSATPDADPAKHLRVQQVSDQHLQIGWATNVVMFQPSLY